MNTYSKQCYWISRAWISKKIWKLWSETQAVDVDNEKRSVKSQYLKRSPGTGPSPSHDEHANPEFLSLFADQAAPSHHSGAILFSKISSGNLPSPPTQCGSVCSVFRLIQWLAFTAYSSLWWFDGECRQSELKYCRVRFQLDSTWLSPVEVCI